MRRVDAAEVILSLTAIREVIYEKFITTGGNVAGIGCPSTK